MCVDNSPCEFTCTNGYTTSPSTDCVCEVPNVVCNGNCVAPGACPSSQTTVKKRWVGSGSCTEKEYDWAACGVFGRAHGPGSASTPHAIWRAVCVPGLAVARTTHFFFITKTSSGGFVFPLTPFSPIGQDCTALPGVADVSCLSGECAVHRCMPGYALSHDGTHCIPAQDHISRPHVAMPGDDAACTPRQYTCKRSRK